MEGAKTFALDRNREYGGSYGRENRSDQQRCECVCVGQGDAGSFSGSRDTFYAADGVLSIQRLEHMDGRNTWRIIA